MSKTYKKKKKKQSLHIQGFAAFSMAAAALALILFILVPKVATTPEPSTEPPIESTQPPVPLSQYGPEDFEYGQDGYLRSTDGKSVLGIDVSDHQKEIDWQQVADAGFEFAMIRIGYRGYTSGGLYEDAQAKTNLREARAAGLKVGAYFFSQATTISEAAMEAAYCLDILDGFQVHIRARI